MSSSSNVVHDAAETPDGSLCSGTFMNGKPCTHTAKYTDGRCKKHTSEGAELIVVASTRPLRDAGKNEKKDILKIIEGIKVKNECGRKIVKAFAAKFPGHEIIDAKDRTGENQKTHYDFEVLVRVGGIETWKKVEHKGSHVYSPIKSTDSPWKAGVQWHNGTGDSYSCTKTYTRLWYDKYLASGELTREFGLTTPVPTYDEWFDLDCKVLGLERSTFGKELRKKVKAARPEKGRFYSLLEKRKPINDVLLTDEVKTAMKREVLPIANKALVDKEYWMAIRGDLDGEFYVEWYPQFIITDIKEVTVAKERTDFVVKFECNDGFIFEGWLRWGYGAGFSNIRFDLR